MLTETQIRNSGPEDYMNDDHLAFFKEKLIEAKKEVLGRLDQLRNELNDHQIFADPVDRASAEEERFLALRLREREGNLLKQIDKALRLMREGEYGFCQDSGDEIGIPRLLARPMALTAVESKFISERKQSSFRSAA